MQDEFGDTPLIEACDGGYVAIAALLVDKGARIDYKNKVANYCLFVYLFCNYCLMSWALLDLWET